MTEETQKSPTKPKKRVNKLTSARIKKEIENLRKLFESVDDPARKELIFSLIDEAAFLKVACYQAKEEKKMNYTDEFFADGMADATVMVRAYGENGTFSLWSKTTTITRFRY